MDKALPSNAEVEGSQVVVVDYRGGGRALDNNSYVFVVHFICVNAFWLISFKRVTTLYIWKGKMHVQHMYSSKYFDQKTFEDLHARTIEYFVDFVASANLQVIATTANAGKALP